MTSTLVVSAIPYYLIALLAWIFLTQKYSVFPDTEYNPLFDDGINVSAWAGGLLLPWLVLGLTNATAYSRYTRGQMVETLGEDYIRTAVAKGQKENTVVFRHALRAAIIPVVTIFGLDFATLLGGTIFTEFIFDIDGMGRWALERGDRRRRHPGRDRDRAGRRRRSSWSPTWSSTSSTASSTRGSGWHDRRDRTAGRGRRGGHRRRALPGRGEPHRQVPHRGRPRQRRQRPELHRRAGQDPRHRGRVGLRQVRVEHGRPRPARREARPGSPARSGSAAPRSSGCPRSR